MTNFTHRKKEIEFWNETGEVLGNNKYSETQVSSSGGGGYVGKSGGYVSPTKISSTSITNHQFWIKTDDGVEKDVKLIGVDIPLRTGQMITLISAKNKGSNEGLYSVLINHSANKHWFVRGAASLNKGLNVDQMTGKSILVGGAIWWGLSYVTDSIELGAIVACGFVLYRFVTKLVRGIKLNRALSSHLEKLAQAAYQNC